MKNTCRLGLSLPIAIMGLAVQGSALTVDLSAVIQGNEAVYNSWLKMDVNAGANPGEVLLTLRATEPSPSYSYRVDDWMLNVSPGFVSGGVAQLTLNEQSKSGTFTSPTVFLNGHNTAKGGLFNIFLSFDQTPSDTDHNFGNGESITYLITSSIIGLTLNDFLVTSDNGQKLGYVSAADLHYNNDFTVATAGGGDAPGIPDAGSTVTLIGLSLLSLTILRRRLGLS